MKKKSEAEEKQEFLDATAQQMYAAGFPLTNIWPHVEKLWNSRQAYIKAEAKKNV